MVYGYVIMVLNSAKNLPKKLHKCVKMVEFCKDCVKILVFSNFLLKLGCVYGVYLISLFQENYSRY